MAQLRGPNAFFQVAELLVENVRNELADSLGGPVQRACVVPGEIVWDNCNCGLLAVSYRDWSLTDEFPDASAGAFGANAVTRATPCDMPWLVGELRIEVARCAPIPQDGAITVPCDVLEATAQIQLSDAYVVMSETLRTLCELRETDQIIDYIVSSQTSVGPAADCVGSQLLASVGVMR